MLLLIHCLLFLSLFEEVCLCPLSYFVFGSCFEMQYFVFFLILQSSHCGRENRLLDINFVLAAMWLLVFCESTVWCHGLVCCL